MESLEEIRGGLYEKISVLLGYVFAIKITHFTLCIVSSSVSSKKPKPPKEDNFGRRNENGSGLNW